MRRRGDFRRRLFAQQVLPWHVFRQCHRRLPIRNLFVLVAGSAARLMPAAPPASPRDVSSFVARRAQHVPCPRFARFYHAAAACAVCGQKERAIDGGVAV